MKNRRVWPRLLAREAVGEREIRGGGWGKKTRGVTSQRVAHTNECTDARTSTQSQRRVKTKRKEGEYEKKLNGDWRRGKQRRHRDTHTRRVRSERLENAAASLLLGLGRRGHVFLVVLADDADELVEGRVDVHTLLGACLQVKDL